MANEYRYIREMRQRLGLEEDDPRRDSDIDKMSPNDRFRLLCGWFLGDSVWASTILSWAKDARMKIEDGSCG